MFYGEFYGSHFQVWLGAHTNQDFNTGHCRILVINNRQGLEEVKKDGNWTK